MSIPIPTHDASGRPYTLEERRTMSMLAEQFVHDITPCSAEGWGECSAFTNSTAARVDRLFYRLLGAHAQEFHLAYAVEDKGWVISFAKSRKTHFKCVTVGDMLQCWTALQLHYVRRWFRGEEV